MEPVSILSAAAAISAVAGKAYELGSFVRELCQGAKTVDGRVRRLESALTELARACEHVEGQFRSMSSRPSTQTPTLAWDTHGTMTTSIERQVKDCRKTLKELRRLLVDLRPGSSSFFGRTSRHIKLQDRGQQISDFGARVKTHTDALQMSLQIVIIRIALATPDFLLQQLAMALEDLGARLSRIENKIDQPVSRKDIMDCHGGLQLDIARDILREGTTLYETSIAGSVADVESATGSERASRIREWAESVDVLRRTHDNNSGIYLPSTAPACASAEKEFLDEGPDNTPSPESSTVSCPEGRFDSAIDKISVELAHAAHDIPLAGDGEKLPISCPTAGDISTETGLAAIDGAEHIIVDNYDSTDSSQHPVPACTSITPGSPHLSNRSSFKVCTDRSHRDGSDKKTTDQEHNVDQGGMPDQGSSTPGEVCSEAASTAKHKPYKYPMDTSDPLTRSDRESCIEFLQSEFMSELEALICTGEHIETAILSQLVAADEAASTVQLPATASQAQQGKSNLALLLAVCFRDVYLIKPLIEHGFSPNARLKVYSDEELYTTATEDAVAIRCEPVIQELLDNGAKLPYTCQQSPWFELLDHKNLDQFPPTSVESVQSVIDLLMQAQSSEPVACVCDPKSVRQDGTCYPWETSLPHDACNMPTHLSQYQMPLVTYLLEYFVSGQKSSRFTADSPLCNAIFYDSLTATTFLIQNADGLTLKAWLRRKNWAELTPLYEAMMRAVNDSTLSLDIVRSLLEIGANLESYRWAQLGLFRFTRKQTARQFALESGRADLVALVKQHGKSVRSRST